MDKGLSTPDLETSRLKRTMIANSNTTVLLADSSKIGNVCFSKFANREEMDYIISDEGMDNEFLTGARERGVEVKIV